MLSALSHRLFSAGWRQWREKKPPVTDKTNGMKTRHTETLKLSVGPSNKLQAAFNRSHLKWSV